MIFVGTEPAVKVACDNNYKNTLVMATPLTVHSDRLNYLIEENIKDNENIMLVSCDGLANAIETNNEDKINSILHSLLDKYISMDINAIVLGCTHYPLIKDKIQNLFKNSVIIDGNIGVAKRVKYLLVENNLLNNSNEIGSIEYIDSKKE